MSRTDVEQIVIILYDYINILPTHSRDRDITLYYSKEWLHILLVYALERTRVIVMCAMC